MSQHDATLVHVVRGALATYYEAERVVTNEGGVNRQDPRWCAYLAAREELSRLAEEIPERPRSAAHVLLLAELAYHFADKEADGTTLKRGDDDFYSARLIEAVLAWIGGIGHD